MCFLLVCAGGHCSCLERTFVRVATEMSFGIETVIMPRDTKVVTQWDKMGRSQGWQVEKQLREIRINFLLKKIINRFIEKRVAAKGSKLN